MSEFQNDNPIENNTLPPVVDQKAIDKAIENLKAQNAAVMWVIFLGFIFCSVFFAVLLYFWFVTPLSAESGHSNPIGFFLLIPPFCFPVLLVLTIPVISSKNKIITTLKKEKPEPSYCVSLSKTEQGKFFASYKKNSIPSKDDPEIELATDSCSEIAIGAHSGAFIFFEKWSKKPVAILVESTILIVAYEPPQGVASKST